MNAGLAKASKHNFPKPATLFAEGSQVEQAFLHDSAELAQHLFNWGPRGDVHVPSRSVAWQATIRRMLLSDRRSHFRYCYSICSELILGDSLPSLPSALLTSIQRMVSHCYLHNQQTWIQQWILNLTKGVHIAQFELQSNSLLIQKIGVGPWVFSSRALEFLSFKKHQPMRWVSVGRCHNRITTLVKKATTSMQKQQSSNHLGAATVL